MNVCVECGATKNPRFLVDDRCPQCRGTDTGASTNVGVQNSTRSTHAERRDTDQIIVTTEMQPAIGIQKRISIVTAECAYGMNLFKDLFSGVRNVVGGRSKAVEKTMKDARETVLAELKQEALAVGANAVVGVELHYTQIGDRGQTMVMVIASGTAV
ncbi:MAG: YbjQ family protein, partial [Roseovarius sp.]